MEILLTGTDREDPEAPDHGLRCHTKCSNTHSLFNLKPAGASGFCTLYSRPNCVGARVGGFMVLLNTGKPVHMPNFWLNIV